MLLIGQIVMMFPQHYMCMTLLTQCCAHTVLYLQVTFYMLSFCCLKSKEKAFADKSDTLVSCHYM